MITYKLSSEKVVDGNWPQGDTGESRTQSNVHHVSSNAKYVILWEEISRSENFNKMGGNNLFQLTTTMITCDNV